MLQQKATYLVTGGAGFIGSNIIESLLKKNQNVVCLDNFSTGKKENVLLFLKDKNFKLIEGDIRIFNDCKKSLKGVDYVFHEAALGSVPRSIIDPITTNDVNICGFINMLIASRDALIKRFVYAASSSTYGDSESLPKIEEIIGNPLSPYAITKYVNELYADVFNKTYGIDCVGLRYFNVFGKKQDPMGAYAAVIPLFIKKLINHESPIINGNGEYSRDFTYIENVIQANLLAISTTNPLAINTIYNVAFGENTTLNELIQYLKLLLSKYDKEIEKIEIKYKSNRIGDIPHSLASITKARKLLGYNPEFNFKDGLKETVEWYWNNL